MRSDPQLQTFVIYAGSAPNLSQPGKHSIRWVEDGPSDIGMILRIFVYIDPGVGFKFNHTYVTRADATMTEPRTESGRQLLRIRQSGLAGFARVERRRRGPD